GPPRPKKEVPTLEEFKTRFLTDYVKANRLKASGIAHKETYLRLYLIPVLGKERLDAISNADVQRLKSRHGREEREDREQCAHGPRQDAPCRSRVERARRDALHSATPQDETPRDVARQFFVSPVRTSR